VPRGSVVSQMLWLPQAVAEAELQMPIFFESSNGRLGYSLDDAASGRFASLLNPQQSAPLDMRSTTLIRIEVSDIPSTVVRSFIR
jgi:hypothetical protein